MSPGVPPELSPTILVVDDTPANLKLIVEVLENHGYQVAVAQDGAEGLRRARLIRPALILLDVMMPGDDGFAICRQLKADAATRDIPVVFMSALADTGNKLAGFEAGGVDYVTKPFDNAEVLTRVATHLALCATQAALLERNAELEASKRRLEEAHGQLLQAEKMSAIGQLAAGVAHEINNPVGYVSANLGTLTDYVHDLLALIASYERYDALIATDPARRELIAAVKTRVDLAYLKTDVIALLAESQDGLQRVKKIVQDLRDFSRVDSNHWQLADLHRGLDSTLNIVANELKHKATVIKEYGELPEIECLSGELNQVFLNLLVNAGHAIAEQGEVRLRTGTADDTVWIEIADNGCGIAPEIMPRIFDPFFTTKPIGKGTGLGLSLSYSIIQRHHGRIEVDSAPGQGCRFRIILPIRQPPKESAGAAEAS